MNTAYLSALAALAGSAIGGLTSFFSSWLTQNAQLKAQLFLRDRARRQKLYGSFVDEASRLYIDALTRSTANLSDTIQLYALISRMRVQSSPRVVEEAEKIARAVVDSYSRPNRTFEDFRAMVDDHSFDPLRSFAEACRDELASARLPLAEEALARSLKSGKEQRLSSTSRQV